MNALVSVVIPTYNRARDLKRALNSVVAQTFSDWEVLVVDNHSNDNTDDLVKSFSDPRMSLLKIHNEGVIAASRNLGIEHSQGEYIAFLDSDDWWLPKKLESSLKYLGKGADIVYHDMYVVTRAGQKRFWRKDRARDLTSPVFEDLICNGNALKNSSVVVRRKLLKEIGGLAEDDALVAMEDYDAWLRAGKVTEKFKRIPETLGYYWAGGGNTGDPRKAIKHLDAFERRYSTDLRKLNMGVSGTWWVNYSRGRAYYLSGCHADAKMALNKLRWAQVSLGVVVKTIWMKSMISLLHRSEVRRTG